MTRFALLSPAIFMVACGTATPPTPTPQPGAVAEVKSKAKIDQFYSPTSKVPKGGKATLCYGVSGTKELKLSPREAEVWPAVSRCIEVTPKQTTTYTLTAIGVDGNSVKKSVTLTMGAPHARIFDIWASSIDQQAGQPLRICFKTENATRVTVSAGKFDSVKNCIDDNPMKNTSYRISVYGAEGEPALGQVDVKVHP